MQRIVVNMQNFLLSDAVQQALRNNGDFSVTVAEKPVEVTRKCLTTAATVLLMEVTEYPQWKLEDRMDLCREIRKQSPHCKLVLLVDENAQKSAAEQIKQSKRDGLIDNFIYGSVSTSYLAAVLDTL